MMNSDQELDDNEEYEFDQQTSNERRIEQQLDDFRNKWKTEIQQRTVYGYVLNDEKKPESEQQIDNEEQAKHFFERASDLEREGKLYDAIKYYRAAMQLVPDIEFRMARKGATASSQQQTTTTTADFGSMPETTNDDPDAAESVDDETNLFDSIHRLNLDDNESGKICQKNFPQQATHISSLPSEVLIYIFRWVISSDLDVRSLEQCARVCRGFYLCARDPQLWKMICLKIWGIQTGNPLASVNWRHMFINRPHVVFNGVYISRATYIRQGEQSLDSFYSPWHLVEYYRYIRFFPDGVVLIYTSADDPKQTVGRLKNRYAIRDPSLIYGNYRLQNTRVLIVAKRTTQRNTIVSSTQRRAGKDLPASDIEQTMHMEFEMCDAGKRKHHQLVWTHYEIKFTNKRTGEERPTLLDVRDDRHAYPPLIFSRVKSYTLAAEQPLK